MAEGVSECFIHIELVRDELAVKIKGDRSYINFGIGFLYGRSRISGGFVEEKMESGIKISGHVTRGCLHRFRGSPYLFLSVLDEIV